MKIVTNGKGLYAIRKGWWFTEYIFFDIKNPSFWWKNTSQFYIDCWSDKERVDYWFSLLNPKVVRR